MTYNKNKKFKRKATLSSSSLASSLQLGLLFFLNLYYGSFFRCSLHILSFHNILNSFFGLLNISFLSFLTSSNNLALNLSNYSLNNFWGHQSL